MKNKYIKLISKNIGKVFGIFSNLPFLFFANKIASPKYVSHHQWVDFLVSQFNHVGMRILEIGSRNVTGPDLGRGWVNLRSRFSKAQYVGFDFYPGENVDIVGDVHQLTNYFSETEQFDLIFSSAVFEHLHMPWVAAQEIQKMLKVGGFVFIETHFSFSSHERPWHFFQFSDVGLRTLFNKSMGFELIDAGMSNPIVGFFSARANRHLRFLPVTELYCHSEILCKKISNGTNFDWNTVNIDEIVEGTRYPISKIIAEDFSQKK